METNWQISEMGGKKEARLPYYHFPRDLAFKGVDVEFVTGPQAKGSVDIVIKKAGKEVARFEVEEDASYGDCSLSFDQVKYEVS